jgi:serine/threonine protein phosphatase PrpC
LDSIGFAHTYVGRRDRNEDCHLAKPDLGLYVVADGMGGHDGGEVASHLAVDIVHDFFERAAERAIASPHAAEDMMEMAFRLAHREVARERVGPLSEMGTTLAAVFLHGAHATIAHVGDSRVYRLRDGRLDRLTRDHSLYAEIEAAGVTVAIPAARAFGHVITRAIGVPGNADPEISTVEVEPGDSFLLCTDGLTDTVDDDRIATILRELTPELAASALIGEAWINDSSDNITVVVAQVPVPSARA